MLKRERGSLPLYKQLEMMIRESIDNGDFSYGDILPAESEYMAKFGISRITIRQAMQLLASEGYVQGRPGKGTIVTKKKIEEALTGIKSFSDEMREHGVEMETLSCKAGYSDTPDYIASILGMFVVQFLIGIVFGYLLGRLAVIILNRLNIDNQAMYPILLLAVLFFTFAMTSLLRGNGYLAVYLAGMMVGNHRMAFRRETTTFMDGLTWLFQVVMFLCLGLLVNPHEMLQVAAVASLIGAFMVLVGRPLSVWLSLLPFKKSINRRSLLFVSWVGLRGAAPILFAIYPVVAGVEGAQSIFNIVFFITIISLIVQGTTISRMAHALKLSAPLPKTGNDFGVEIPEDIGSDLHEITVTGDMALRSPTLKDMRLPKGTLVMIVKRGEEFLIPNGSLRLQAGDKLLIISEKNAVPPSPLPKDEEA